MVISICKLLLQILELGRNVNQNVSWMSEDCWHLSDLNTR